MKKIIYQICSTKQHLLKTSLLRLTAHFFPANHIEGNFQHVLLGTKISFTAVIFLLYACNKQMDDYATNPNAESKIPATEMLPAVQYRIGALHCDISHTVSMYAQYLASPTGSEVDRYGYVSLDEIWSDAYLNLSNIQTMINLAQSDNQQLLEGAGKVLFCLNLSYITDLWGNVPYTDALMDAQNTTPNYDSQEFIYAKMAEILSEAIVLLSAKIEDQLYNDIMLDGNKQTWLQFAYSLKCRLLLRTAQNTSDYEYLQMIADSAFTASGTVSVNCDYRNENPWYKVVQNNEDGGILGGYLSSFLVNSLLNDTTNINPLLLAITDSLNNGTFAGTTNGGTPPASGFCTLRANSFVTSAESPIIIISNAEIYFIKAECLYRTGDMVQAQTECLSGISQYLQDAEVNEPEQFVNYEQKMFAKNGIQLNDILQHKWISLVLNPEGWNLLRENQYSLSGFSLPINSLLNGNFIQRLPYPNSEYLLNATNIPANDHMTDALWWTRN